MPDSALLQKFQILKYLSPTGLVLPIVAIFEYDIDQSTETDQEPSAEKAERKAGIVPYRG
jgi:hypothetical protein